MPVSEAQKRAKARYDRHTKQFVFRFREDADADIIWKLTNVRNKAEYIRELIRRDIAHES